MSPQADYVVSNGTGAAVRSDINGQLAAIVSNNSGASAPATTYAYMLWADTSTNLLKLRNGANSAWITVGDLTAANLGLATLASPTFTGTATIPTLTVSTAANIPLGSAASPTLYFTGDSNTGLYSPGADQVALSTGGTGRLFIDSSGRVGIGTSTPQAVLESKTASVQAGDSAYAKKATIANIPYSTNNITSSALAIYDGSIHAADIGYSYDGSGYYLTLGTSLNTVSAPTERLRIDRLGRVGIGTQSPGSALDVRGSTSASLYIGRTSNAGAGSEPGYIDFRGPNASGNDRTWVQLKSIVDDATQGSEDAQLVFGHQKAGNLSEAMRIDGSSRVLVGTSTQYSGISSQLLNTASAGASTFAGLAVTTYSASSGANAGSIITLDKSNSNTLGTNTAVANNDQLGIIAFRGADGGSSFRDAAYIQCFVDGAVSGGGVGDMPGRLVFSTTADGASSPTERMRIDSSGNILGGGMTGLTAGSSVKGFNFESQTNNGRLNLHANSSAGTASGINFYHSGSQVGGITYSSTATAYNTSSDYRLKENVDAVINGIARLQQLKPCRFNFIADPNKTVDGFIAHEVQAVVPEAINGEKDAVDDDGNPIYQGIDQSKLVPLLTAALQEAIAKIETLEARLTALESA